MTGAHSRREISLANLAKKFICQNCGASFRKWVGHCYIYNEWNTIVQEELVHNFSKTSKNRKGSEIEHIKNLLEFLDHQCMSPQPETRVSKIV